MVMAGVLCPRKSWTSLTSSSALIRKTSWAAVTVLTLLTLRRATAHQKGVSALSAVSRPYAASAKAAIQQFKTVVQAVLSVWS
jgi:hypothetical protein